MDNQKREELNNAKRALALIYLGMASDDFSEEDVEIFSWLMKDKSIQQKLKSISETGGNPEN